MQIRLPRVPFLRLSPAKQNFIQALLTLPPGYSFHRYDHWFHIRERNEQKRPEINIMQKAGVMLLFFVFLDTTHRYQL
jgi:hypothetical protein